MEFRLPSPVCPNCHEELDGAAEIHGSDAIPKPGDGSVCAHCGMILRYTECLQLEVANPLDWPPAFQAMILQVQQEVFQHLKVRDA